MQKLRTLLAGLWLICKLISYKNWLIYFLCPNEALLRMRTLMQPLPRVTHHISDHGLSACIMSVVVRGREILILLSMRKWFCQNARVLEADQIFISMSHFQRMHVESMNICCCSCCGFLCCCCFVCCWF